MLWVIIMLAFGLIAIVGTLLFLGVFTTSVVTAVKESKEGVRTRAEAKADWERTLKRNEEFHSSLDRMRDEETLRIYKERFRGKSEDEILAIIEDIRERQRYIRQSTEAMNFSAGKERVKFIASLDAEDARNEERISQALEAVRTEKQQSANS